METEKEINNIYSEFLKIINPNPGVFVQTEDKERALKCVQKFSEKIESFLSSLLEEHNEEEILEKVLQENEKWEKINERLKTM